MKSLLCSFLMISCSLFANEEFELHRQIRAEERGIEKMESLSAVKASVYVSVHNGAYQHPVSVSYLGDTIDTENGARYVVAPEDRYQTFKWFSGDTIVLIPNHALFSTYYFKLVNLNTNDVVKVNLLLKPIKNSIFTYWVAAVDKVNSVVLLNDGTFWSVSSFDTYLLRKNWLDYDTVILGINDDWLSGSYGNFLYNVDANNTVRAQCQF